MIPVVPIEPLDLPRLGPHHDDLWTTLCDLGDAHDEDWVIIGGQMVMLHALEAGREPGRVSQDLDTVIDARVRPPALPAFLATLANLGFTSAGVSPDEVAHRFERGSVHVDVLGPDGLGGRSDLRTVGTATTIQVGGGTQALQRAERFTVRHGDAHGARDSARRRQCSLHIYSGGEASAGEANKGAPGRARPGDVHENRLVAGDFMGNRSHGAVVQHS